MTKNGCQPPEPETTGKKKENNKWIVKKWCWFSLHDKGLTYCSRWYPCWTVSQWFIRNTFILSFFSLLFFLVHIFSLPRVQSPVLNFSLTFSGLKNDRILIFYVIERHIKQNTTEELINKRVVKWPKMQAKSRYSVFHIIIFCFSFHFLSFSLHPHGRRFYPASQSKKVRFSGGLCCPQLWSLGPSVCHIYWFILNNSAAWRADNATFLFNVL